jgi:hypothetical protein
VRDNSRCSGNHEISVGYEETYDSSSFDFDVFLEIPSLEVGEGRVLENRLRFFNVIDCG